MILRGWVLGGSIFIIKKMLGGVMEKIIARIIEEIFKRMSPQLREMIIDAVKKLDEKAKTTPNPWDDLVVLVFKVALGLD